MSSTNNEVYSAMHRRFSRADLEDIDDAVSASRIATWEAREAGVEIYNESAFRTCVARRYLSRHLKWSHKYIYPDRDEGLDWEALAERQGAALEVMDHEDRVDAATVIDSAPDIYAEVLRMHYLEGKAFQEIAKEQGVSSDCVRKRHERALKWARKKFTR